MGSVNVCGGCLPAHVCGMRPRFVLTVRGSGGAEMLGTCLCAYHVQHLSALPGWGQIVECLKVGLVFGIVVTPLDVTAEKVPVK